MFKVGTVEDKLEVGEIGEAAEMSKVGAVEDRLKGDWWPASVSKCVRLGHSNRLVTVDVGEKVRSGRRKMPLCFHFRLC